MIPELGHFALVLALVLALVQSVPPLVGAATRASDLQLIHLDDIGPDYAITLHRWREAWEAGVAPPVSLEATHEQALEVVTLDMLKSAALESGKPAF